MVKPWQYAPQPVSPSRGRRPKRSPELSPLQEAELLHRRFLGYMDTRAHHRLEALFSEPPPDMTARLLKACEHLGVTGEHAELFGLAAEHRGALKALWQRVEAGAWPIGNLEVLKAYLKRARAGDAEALTPVIAYVMHEAVAAELATQLHERTN